MSRATYGRAIRTAATIKGEVLTRLVQLALRGIFSAEPLERLRELIALIDQIQDRDTAVAILESLLRYYVQGTQRIEEPEVHALLKSPPVESPSCRRSSIDTSSKAASRESTSASSKARRSYCCV
jgi:hypothetical protein